MLARTPRTLAAGLAALAGLLLTACGSGDSEAAPEQASYTESPPGGPHTNCPVTRPAPKVSFRKPYRIHRAADHEGLPQDPFTVFHPFEQDPFSSSPPPVPTVMYVRPPVSDGAVRS